MAGVVVVGLAVVGVPRIYGCIGWGFRPDPIGFARGFGLTDPQDQLPRSEELPESYVERVVAARGADVHPVMLDRTEGTRYLPRTGATFDTVALTFEVRRKGEGDAFPYVWRLTFWRVGSAWLLTLVEQQQAPISFGSKHV